MFKREEADGLLVIRLAGQLAKHKIGNARCGEDSPLLI
jgi:hypothetical protein